MPPAQPKPPKSDSIDERVATWPLEAQGDLVRFIIDTEVKYFGTYGSATTSARPFRRGWTRRAAANLPAKQKSPRSSRVLDQRSELERADSDAAAPRRILGFARLAFMRSGLRLSGYLVTICCRNKLNSLINFSNCSCPGILNQVSQLFPIASKTFEFFFAISLYESVIVLNDRLNSSGPNTLKAASALACSKFPAIT
jgi:hypothetical protein